MDHDGSPPSLAVETGGGREGERNLLGWMEEGRGKAREKEGRKEGEGEDKGREDKR